MRHLLAILLSTAIVLAPPALWAQGKDLPPEQQERLMTLIEEGKETYDAGQFELSLEKFRQAYDIYPHPDIVYRIALCHERLGEDQQAVEHYRQFLREAPDAPERARVEKTIQVIESRIAKSEIQITTVPEGAVVYIDDVANGAAGYTPTKLAVKPGNYTLIVEKEGYDPVRELVTVQGGQLVQVRYQLTERGSGSAPPEGTVTEEPRRPRTGPSVKLITLLSLGVASGIVSFVFFGLHADKRAQLEDLDGQRQDIPRDRYDKVKRQTQINLGVAVSTAALSVFSLIWAYGVWQAELTSRRTAIAPPSGPSLGWSDGPVIGYQWRF